MITDAIILAKNETDICDETIASVEVKPTIIDDNCNNQTDTVIDENLRCPCNDTEEIPHLQQVKLDQQTPCNDEDPEINIKTNVGGVSNSTTEDCNEIKVNELADTDTVLKYVYKKKDNITVPEKTKGHFKNTLKRRKRSYSRDNHDIENGKNSFEYTSNKDREIILPLRLQNTPNVVRADFNIETVHDSWPLHKHSEKFQKSNDKEDFEGRRKNNYQTNEKPRDDSSYKHKRKELVSRDSNESGEKYSEEDKLDNSNDRSGNREKYVGKSNEEYATDSNENHNYNKDKNSSDEKPSEESSYSSERKNEHLTNKRKDDVIKHDEDHSNESNEYSQEKENDNDSGEKKARIKESSPLNIQDVDLDDFSHERIQVNNKGEVESAKDSHANLETDSSHEIIPVTKPDIESNESEEKKSQSLEATDVPSLEINQPQLPVNINDGEIKPVVELINEGDRSDNSEEKVVNLSDENTSSESDTKEIDSNEKNDKLIAQKNKDENVKQEFERIPLNYKHDKKELQNNDEKGSDKTLPIFTKPENADEGDSDGTIDSLSKDRLDENLNIKFDDVAIKLPEIKLPDDILSYNYEEPAYLKDDKQNHKHYDDDDEYHNERLQKKKNKDENRSDDYNNDDDAEDSRRYRDYNYYNDDDEKQDYKKKEKKDNEEDEEAQEDEEEDVDLYEKFVRERFGKKGSFEQRSEKLEDATHISENPALFATIKKILKKTEDTHKEAENSGDPNAGYMWTLEYGENL